VQEILQIAYSLPVLSPAVKSKIPFGHQNEIGDRRPLEPKRV
jgi:hypothetical protein